MHWGIRRTKKEIQRDLANPKSSDIMRSKKRFKIDSNKLDEYMLKPDARHSKDMFELGYKENDRKRLFKDIEKGYDQSKITDRGGKKYCIYMN